MFLRSVRRSVCRRRHQQTMGVVLRGTESLLTLCWREMDSNFQYAGAVNLFVAPFVVPGCLKSPPATRSRRKRQGPFQGLRVPRHPAQEDVVGGSAGTAPHDLPVASVRCLYCFCPSHFASVGEHRSYAREAFRRLHPQPSTERAAAPVQATSKAGSLRRLPIRPKQPGASKGATTSFTAPAY